MIKHFVLSFVLFLSIKYLRFGLVGARCLLIEYQRAFTLNNFFVQKL